MRFETLSIAFIRFFFIEAEAPSTPVGASAVGVACARMLAAAAAAPYAQGAAARRDTEDVFALTRAFSMAHFDRPRGMRTWGMRAARPPPPTTPTPTPVRSSSWRQRERAAHAVRQKRLAFVLSNVIAGQGKRGLKAFFSFHELKRPKAAVFSAPHVHITHRTSSSTQRAVNRNQSIGSPRLRALAPLSTRTRAQLPRTQHRNTMLRQQKVAAAAGGNGDDACADAAFQSHDQLPCAGAAQGADSFSALTQAFSTRLSELQQLVCLRIEGAFWASWGSCWVASAAAAAVDACARRAAGLSDGGGGATRARRRTRTHTTVSSSSAAAAAAFRRVPLLSSPPHSQNTHHTKIPNHKLKQHRWRQGPVQAGPERPRGGPGVGFRGVGLWEVGRGEVWVLRGRAPRAQSTARLCVLSGVPPAACTGPFFLPWRLN
jgi:hypothetical protein